MSEIDERFKRGKIYTIRNKNDDTLIYVGSTINTLLKRYGEHKQKCKGGKCSISLYKYIIDNDWTDWYCELYEDFPCNNKNQLNRREGEVIRLIGSINKVIHGRTMKQWRIDNADKIKKYVKEYNIKNVDKKNIYQTEYHKGYRENNADEIAKYKKDYYENNKQFILEKHKQHYEDKKEIVICDHCESSILKTSLKIHQKTAKCLKAQQKN